MAKKIKPNTVVLKNTYKKGVFYENIQELIKHLENKDTKVELINEGRFHNKNEFITIKIILSDEYLQTL